jgi:hypothetical protein
LSEPGNAVGEEGIEKECLINAGVQEIGKIISSVSTIGKLCLTTINCIFQNSN